MAIILSQFFQSCFVLPGRLQNHKCQESFLNEFKQIFDSQQAKNASNVLYVFVCEKKIPRVKSKSSVVYIGKTEQNLRSRWLKYGERLCSDYNWPFFSYVIAHYGKIKIAFLPVQSLKQGETDLLKDYYKKHKEMPPKNSQRWKR